MSSVSNCIKMAILLKNRGRMKTIDLARELNVTERQIQTYKKYLEEAGIWIDSKFGKYGGYELIGELPIIKNITERELIVLDMINEELKHNNNLYKDEFYDIVNTIKSTVTKYKEDQNIMEYFTIQPKSNPNNLKQKKICEDIVFCYITKRKIKIQYHSISSGLSTRIVHPYGITTYKGDSYMVAFCEKRKKVLDFKICRINDYTILEDKYSIDKHFSWDNYIKNCIGIYKGNEIKVTLEIRNDFRYIVKEKIWVDDQKITDFGDYIIFEAKMRGYNEIKSWILSMGSNVKVIEPQNLKDDILREVKQIIEYYK